MHIHEQVLGSSSHASRPDSCRWYVFQAKGTRPGPDNVVRFGTFLSLVARTMSKSFVDPTLKWPSQFTALCVRYDRRICNLYYCPPFSLSFTLPELVVPFVYVFPLMGLFIISSNHIIQLQFTSLHYSTLLPLT